MLLKNRTLGIVTGTVLFLASFSAAYTKAWGQTEAERYYNQAMQSYTAGSLDEALNAAKKALELEPASPRAFNYLGIIHKKMGHLEDAAACFNKALEVDPGFAPAHSNLGMIYMDKIGRAHV